MNNFTELQIVTYLREEENFDEPLCLDFMDDACNADSIEDAASMIMIDSALWNGTF